MKNLAIFSYSLILVFVATSASAARLSVLFGGSGGSSVNSGYVRMFVTSTTYDGNLGGIAGADAKCQARASAANLGGTWKAIISDSTTSAKSRMTHRTKPVFNLAGYLVWNPTVPLMFSSDSSTSTGAPPWGNGSYLGNEPNITELGTTVTTYVWTGTTTAGALYGTYHCSNWTSNAATGGYGDPANRSAYWILQGSVGCSNSYRLYCLEDE